MTEGINWLLNWIVVIASEIGRLFPQGHSWTFHLAVFSGAIAIFGVMSSLLQSPQKRDFTGVLLTFAAANLISPGDFSMNAGFFATSLFAYACNRIESRIGKAMVYGILATCIIAAATSQQNGAPLPTAAWLVLIVQIRVATWITSRTVGAGSYRLLSHAFAPPFFAFPVAHAWLSLTDFLEIKRQKHLGDAARYLAWAILLILQFSVAQQALPWVFSGARDLPTLDGLQGGSEARVLAGLVFFYERFSLLAGATAAACGIWRLFGCAFPYEFRWPILSVSVLDFWARYQSLSRRTIWQCVLFPISISLSRFLPNRVSIGIALMASISILSLINASAMDPAIWAQRTAGTNLFLAYFRHFTCIFLFVLLAELPKNLANRIALHSAWTQWPLRIVCGAFTLWLIGALFYGGYAHIFAGKSLTEFFLLVMPFRGGL
jgi:hypothetical protein